MKSYREFSINHLIVRRFTTKRCLLTALVKLSFDVLLSLCGFPTLKMIHLDLTDSKGHIPSILGRGELLLDLIRKDFDLPESFLQKLHETLEDDVNQLNVHCRVEKHVYWSNTAAFLWL